ncbi:MAG: ribonucleotide reductase [Aphanocapsa sp. GSE-SYN-MK-11-07L]|jgi:hypothetical protein|nr:ribonucleotide reductase [Aphanocapsa sp. GSE-SYN-MK-11-07L]
MPQTKDLLNLIQEFPAAFADPEQAIASPPPSKNQALMALMTEFPEAFADPEAPSAEAPTQAEPVAESIAATVAQPAATALPIGYRQALHRQISTFAWGQIDCELTYGSTGLERIWLTVGKSGTEVQSLCEAIARLVNLLLASGAPIPTLVKELRGIRGGDAEGFGPHRVLGLADLIGKVLQEAPEVGAIPLPTIGREPSAAAPLLPVDIYDHVITEKTAVTSLTSAKPHSIMHEQPASDWASLPTDSRHSASLCPECGSELHQMNGCSGGACNVCGYSSCS